MEKRTKANQKGKGGLKLNSQKIKAKLLKSYYGNPAKDMKVIAITGTTGKVIVAHYVHEILRAAERYGAKGNYVLGANIAGFEKVAEAMTAQGIV